MKKLIDLSLSIAEDEIGFCIVIKEQKTKLIPQIEPIFKLGGTCICIQEHFEISTASRVIYLKGRRDCDHPHQYVYSIEALTWVINSLQKVCNLTINNHTRYRLGSYE